MKRLFLFPLLWLSTLVPQLSAQTLQDDLWLGGTGNRLLSGATLTLKSGSTTTAESGSTVDLHAATITFADGQIGWAKISGTPTTLSGYGIADAQPLDSDLTAIAALTTTSFGRSVLTQADAAALRTLGGVVIGTNVQAWSANLDTFASYTPATLPVSTAEAAADSAVAAAAASDATSKVATETSRATTAEGLLVPKTTTVNGHALSANVTVTPADLSLVIGTNTQAWSANLDTWAGHTPYAGTVVVTTGKTLTASNTLTFTGTDGSTLAIGTGGTLGSNAYTSTAYVPQTTTVNGHALSANVTVTPADLSLVIGTNTQAWSANLDTWSGHTPYAGTVVVTTGKTLTASNTLTFTGTDGSTLAIGTGGTLGTAAYTAASAYDASGAASTAQAYAIQRANHTGTQAWSTLTSTPTTRSGYGITDVAALDLSDSTTQLAVMKVLKTLRTCDLGTAAGGARTTANGGSIGASTTGDFFACSSGSTANGSASLYIEKIFSATNATHIGGSGSPNGLDWTKRFSITFALVQDAHTTNGVWRIQTKRSTTQGAITVRGIGLEGRNTRIWINAHNGTTLTTADTGLDLANNQNHFFTLESDGAGNVTLYDYGVQVGSPCTGGPTTIGNQGENGIAVEVTNGGDSATQGITSERHLLIIGG